jgi:hypothetical protein
MAATQGFSATTAATIHATAITSSSRLGATSRPLACDGKMNRDLGIVGNQVIFATTLDQFCFLNNSGGKNTAGAQS